MQKPPSSVMPSAYSETSSHHPRAAPKQKGRSLPISGVWVTLAGACILAGVSFVTHRPRVTDATAAPSGAPVVGAWTDGGEEWLVLNADGTGARTRPDPTWGSRRYTFRWQAGGGAVSLTEQRVTLPGGSAISVADANEAFSVTSEGETLAWGAQIFRRHNP